MEIEKTHKKHSWPKALFWCRNGEKWHRPVTRMFYINVGLYTPTKRSDAQPLVEREKQFECLPVEISRSEKGKQMLHVLYFLS